MAVKTITIDVEAYDLLARGKREGESFSDIIKAHFGRRPTAGAFRRTLGALRVPADALDAVDAQIRRRAASPARAVRRDSPR